MSFENISSKSTDCGDLGFAFSRETARSSRILRLIGAIVSFLGTTSAIGGIVTQQYQYNGGRFTVVTAFSFNTGIETDAFIGTTRLQPMITITNTSTGRSLKISYVSPSDYVNVLGTNVLVGEEVVPGQQNPKTNTGIVTVDASILGPGPLVFSADNYAQLSTAVPSGIHNAFGAPYYLWTIHPQRITPALAPWKPPAVGGPVAGPPIAPVAPVPTTIHAVIISGRSDPAKVVTASTNVTLTGGVVALGKNPGSSGVPSNWASGLRIVPDDALLTGDKIPPITPNIIDVRIVKHEVVGDLATPDSSP
jgi:hypothetical protein